MAAAEDGKTAAAAARRTRWISHGLEHLILSTAERPDAGRSVDFDVVIVGSGYGGAIAADRLSAMQRPDGRALNVCVLERGREYLAGAFPSRAADLGGHVRFTRPDGGGAKGRLEGLFDLRIGGDMSVLLANGIGGGSLINAGVMEFPQPGVFDSPDWPVGRREHAALSRRAHQIRKELGAGGRDDPNLVKADTFGGELARSAAMRQLGGTAVPITVALDDGRVTSGNVCLDKCIACGDCATGCNHAAKDSLDVNLLRRAAARGVAVYAGATVSRVRRAAGGWELDVWHTDAALRRRMPSAFVLRTQRLILAAGTLGSTEILLRSQTEGLRFSDRLGRRFSGNGDVLAAVRDWPHRIDGVAREATAPGRRRVGPTIMSMIDRRQVAAENFVVQDLGVPAALRRLFEEATVTSALLHDLERADAEPHDPGDGRVDPCAVDPAQVDRSLAVALIGRDAADGLLTLLPDDGELPLDSGLRIDWKAARDGAAVMRSQQWLARRLEGWGARLLPNPLWRLLPESLEQLLGARRGPLLTVHPLGGCAMGESRDGGVVNIDGEVFDRDAADPTATHEGLVVLDGSIVPTSLGINPALTIATLADLAMRQLIADWQLCPRGGVDMPAPERRPIFRRLPEPVRPIETEVQVIEKLTGQVDFAGFARPLHVELSLVYEKKALFPCGKPPPLSGHLLTVAPDPELSRVRVFEQPGLHYGPTRSDAEALLVAPLLGSSTLRFFHREKSTAAERRCRGWLAWLKNRGARDTYQAFADWLTRRTGQSLSPWARLAQSLRLASRAGEVRLFEYSLDLGTLRAAPGPFSSLDGRTGLRLLGRKRLTYERRASPWTQLMRMRIDEFAGLPLGKARSLDIEPAYFATKGVPLLRIVAQQDQPSALIDVLAFSLYVLRILINVHLWSFRKPDRADARLPQRLPGALRGLPAPEVHEFVPEGAAEGLIRLTRYAHPAALAAGRAPVLMIHGYSASGTTFAHPAVDPNLAGHLWRSGIEPWIVDLRTSCGMPTAAEPYTFEQIALADVPAAVRFVCAQTGRQQIDVVTHCMGSAMLAMTLLADDPRAFQVAARIRRWAMSQIGPAMLFTPANTLRAYLVRYVRHLLPGLKYSLRAGGDAPGVDGDLYDRLIASLPYLDDEHGSEFDLENPHWLLPWRRTPWVGTRHRIDALIGRTFDARRMRAATLECIDDFFGPISLTTISQPIHFAKRRFVTGNDGRQPWGDGHMARLAHMRVLCLHGARNGLADPQTRLELMRRTSSIGLHWDFPPLTDSGHQDSLIGRDCSALFESIAAFLKAP